MRLLVVALALALAVPLVPAPAAACHPSFTFATPTDPGVTVSHGTSCDHTWAYVCAHLHGSHIKPAQKCVSGGLKVLA